MSSGFASAVVCLGVCLQTEDKFHVGPYLQFPEAGAVTVMWETVEPEQGEVIYGPTPQLGQRAADNERRQLHQVRITGLLPRTRYFYRLRCGGATSDLHSFRSAPEPGAQGCRIVVYGDSRSYPDRHKRVADLAAGLNADLVLHTGDQVARGTDRPQWKTQFFDPARRLFSHVPVLPSLGNHEESSSDYFDYFHLPGNERYFSFDFGNVHIAVLDSNTWGRSARESEQYKWLEADLTRKRPTLWTLVVFHHPLFSAHDRRPINPARWDWWPLFEGMGVDLVLTGHDHFYYRSRPIGRLGETPGRGTVHVTTAGGGAPLYTTRDRAYTACRHEVHHCTALEFTPEEIRAEAIAVDGTAIDKFRITKQATPANELCAYEAFELERLIRGELESRAPRTVSEDAARVVADDRLEIAHTFRVPVAARLDWPSASDVTPVQLQLNPGKPLVIPVQRQLTLWPVRLEKTHTAGAEFPVARLELIDDRFQNRTVSFVPFKVWRELVVRSQPASHDDDILKDAFHASTYLFSRSNGFGPAQLPAQCRLTHSTDTLVVTVEINRSDQRGETLSAQTVQDEAALLKECNLRLLLGTAEHLLALVVTPSGKRADARDGDWSFENSQWSAAVQAAGVDGWSARVTVPRSLLGDQRDLRFNLVHADPVRDIEDCLSPTFDVGGHPDRVPDFRFGDRTVARFARLLLE
jgi:hypothetical protein